MPHYDRHAGFREPTNGQNDSVFDDDQDAMDEAAQALREAEVESVRPSKVAEETEQLEDMSIDQLRVLAAKLDVPNRGTLTDRALLVAAIRERM